MAVVYVVSHPEVEIRADVPVPQWGLSGAGRARLELLLDEPWVAGVRGVVSSTETKAVQTAKAVAAVAGVQPSQDVELGENDRTSTGYVPPQRFEALVDAFFGRPDESVEGWERAVDAQRRFIGAVTRHVGSPGGPPGSLPAGDVVVAAHGGVGTLLPCRLLGVPITRRLDQVGQGSVLAFDRGDWSVLHGWRRLGEPA